MKACFPDGLQNTILSQLIPPIFVDAGHCLCDFMLAPKFAAHCLACSGYQFKVGAYVQVNCPAISAYEWHPFSLFPVPGAKPRAGFHVEAVRGISLQVFCYLFRISPNRFGFSYWYRIFRLKVSLSGEEARQTSPPTKNACYRNLPSLYSGDWCRRKECVRAKGQ